MGYFWFAFLKTGYHYCSALILYFGTKTPQISKIVHQVVDYSKTGISQKKKIHFTNYVLMRGSKMRISMTHNCCVHVWVVGILWTPPTKHYKNMCFTVWKLKPGKEHPSLNKGFGNERWRCLSLPIACDRRNCVLLRAQFLWCFQGTNLKAIAKQGVQVVPKQWICPTRQVVLTLPKGIFWAWVFCCMFGFFGWFVLGLCDFVCFEILMVLTARLFWRFFCSVSGTVANVQQKACFPIFLLVWRFFFFYLGLEGLGWSGAWRATSPDPKPCFLFCSEVGCVSCLGFSLVTRTRFSLQF